MAEPAQQLRLRGPAGLRHAANCSATGNAQLPLPPMLMFDRISEIAEAGGEYGKGLVRAELDSSRTSGSSPATSRATR